jgi:hypothetical protein
MKSGFTLELLCICVAALLGAGLTVLLTRHNYQPVPVELRGAFPGAGWGWSFDYDLGMQGLGRTQTADSEPLPEHGAEVLECALNIPLRTGTIEITYRGLAPRKKFRIDLVALAVDSQYSYPHEISIIDARKGFALMDRRFKLLDAGRTVLRLQSVPTPRF